MLLKILFFGATLLTAGTAISQETREERAERALRAMRTLCASGIQLEIGSGAGGELKVRDLNANVDVRFSRSEIEGAVKYLNEQMRAQDNSSIRDCMKSQIDKIINFILGISPPISAEKKLSELRIPSIDTPVLKVSEEFPNGSWKLVNSRTVFEYNSEFSGHSFSARYYISNSDPTIFDENRISFSEKFYEAASRSNTPRIQGNDSRVNRLCTSTYSELIRIFIKNFGPPLGQTRTSNRDIGEFYDHCKSPRQSNLRCEQTGGEKTDSTRYKNGNIDITIARTEFEQLVSVSSSDYWNTTEWHNCSISAIIKVN